MFTGLPSPVYATFISVFVISSINISWVLTLAAAVILGLLMISTIQFPHHSHKKLHPMIKATKIPTLVIITLIIINNTFNLTLNHFYITEILLGFIGIYMLSPLLTKK